MSVDGTGTPSNLARGKKTSLLALLCVVACARAPATLPIHVSTEPTLQMLSLEWRDPGLDIQIRYNLGTVALYCRVNAAETRFFEQEGKLWLVSDCAAHLDTHLLPVTILRVIYEQWKMKGILCGEGEARAVAFVDDTGEPQSEMQALCREYLAALVDVTSDHKKIVHRVASTPVDKDLAYSQLPNRVNFYRSQTVQWRQLRNR